MARYSQNAKEAGWPATRSRARQTSPTSSATTPARCGCSPSELDAEQVALTYRRMPQHTGGKGAYGHRHTEQEEIYFVVSGKLQFKLEDEVIERGAGHGDPGRARGRAARSGTTSPRTPSS